MKRNIFKGLLISTLSLAVGFFAIAIPFKFFENLTSQQMTIMFVTELIVYTVVGMIYLVIKQNEIDKRQKQTKTYKLSAKITKLNTEWYDLVA